jgi:outer membrane cobalamin receptor
MNLFRVILFFLICVTLQAQNVVLKGKVRHANTFTGIPAVNIYVRGTSLGTTSQSDGEFVLPIRQSMTDMNVVFEHVAFDTLVLSLEECLKREDFYLQPRVIQLGEISVEAERYPAEIAKDIPQSLAIITAQQYEVQGYIDAGDLLKTEQSIQVNEQLSGEKSISIRAGNAEDVIILFNGVKMNDSYENRFDLSLINLEDLQRVEIIKGSNTSLYGSEAFSGVINFVPKTHQNYNIRFQQKFGSYNSGIWNLQLNHTFSDKFSVSYNIKRGASQREYADAVSGDDLLENRIDYHTANFVYDFSGKNNTEIKHTLSGMFISSGFDYQDKRYGENVSNTNQLYSLHYNGSIAGLRRFTLTGSYQNLDKNENIVTENGGLKLNLKNRRVFFHLEKGFHIKQIEFLFAAQTEYGTLDFSELRSYATSQIGVESADYRTYKNGLVSIFKIHTPTGADYLQVADFDLSYRYDWVHYTPESIIYRDPSNPAVILDKNRWRAPTIKFSSHLSGRFQDYEFNTFLNYGTNIKFASVFQQISSPLLFNPNIRGLTANLNPEKNRSTEIGIDVLHELSHGAVWKGWQIKANYFKNLYENKFRTYFIPGIPIAFFDNVYNAGISGVELMGRVFLFQKKLTLEYGLSKYSITEQAAFPFKSDTKQIVNIDLDHAGYSFQFHWFVESAQAGWIRDTRSSEFRVLSLPAQTNIDIHAGKAFEIYKFKLLVNFSARNLIHDDTRLAGIAIRDRRFYISFGVQY